MKIVFLNVWNAGAGKPFLDFIKEQNADTDIFCFQEAYDEAKQQLQDVLSDYSVYTAFKFITKSDSFPQAIYVKNGIEVVASGEILNDNPDTGLSLYVKLKIESSHLYVCNFHGISRPGDKLDTPARLKQTMGILDFFKPITSEVVIGGDFNLSPETRSIKLFHEYGYKDLIKDFKIENTRNEIAWKEFQGDKQYYSDYVFISKGVKVKQFSVPYNEVSDHLPLILEIE